MNKLYGTASVNGTPETAEGINTINWPILTYMKNRMHNSGCGRCEMKQPKLINWNTSGKYIFNFSYVMYIYQGKMYLKLKMFWN